jgi:hypothetical protein
MPVLVHYLGRPVNPTSVTRSSLANSAGSALYCDKILTTKEFQQELWKRWPALCSVVVDGGLTWSLVSFEALALSFETCVAPARVYTLTVTSQPFANAVKVGRGNNLYAFSS